MSHALPVKLFGEKLLNLLVSRNNQLETKEPKKDFLMGL